MYGTIEGRANLRQYITESIMWDHKIDPWGCGCAAGCALGEVIVWQLGESVPPVLGYRPSPMRPDMRADDHEDYREITEIFDTGNCEAEDVIYWATVIGRYLNIVERAGRSY